jgi:DNA-binding NtrC family response regulator
MTDLASGPSGRSKPTVLVVEDEFESLQLLAEALENDGFEVAQTTSGLDAIERLRGFAYDALVIDLRLPDADGMEVLGEAVALYPGIRVVVITGYGGVADAVQAIKRGAVDFFIKPFQLAQIARALNVAFEQQRLVEENAELRSQLTARYNFDNIVGNSSAMRQVFATLELVAPMTSTVLIQGETGTGKELIARTIHHRSPRRDQNFVAFNAAAIPETLAEAELFGHVKGAFTGATNARVGRFELAHRGTLFIDEVGTMPLSLQAKLLRALQERAVERVGDSRSVKTDIRVIAASNVDLRTLVKEGRFRDDLFYRLNVVPITLPPLRARRDDMPLLAQHFVHKSCKANGLPRRTIAQETLRALMSYPWPGNIREFENAIEHAVAMSGAATEITPEMLPPEMRQPRQFGLLPEVSIPDEGINFTSVVSQLERDLILRCLEKTGGNKRQAARLLQLSRTTLIDKLQRLSADHPAA